LAKVPPPAPEPMMTTALSSLNAIEAMCILLNECCEVG